MRFGFSSLVGIFQNGPTPNVKMNADRTHDFLFIF